MASSDDSGCESGEAITIDDIELPPQLAKSQGEQNEKVTKDSTSEYRRMLLGDSDGEVNDGKVRQRNEMEKKRGKEKRPVDCEEFEFHIKGSDDSEKEEEPKDVWNQRLNKKKARKAREFKERQAEAERQNEETAAMIAPGKKSSSKVSG